MELRRGAKRSGAVALFGEKYGERVRVVQIGSRSRSSSAAGRTCGAPATSGCSRSPGDGDRPGIRRIEAVTGAGAIDFVRKLESELVRRRRGAAVRRRSKWRSGSRSCRRSCASATRRFDELQRKLARRRRARSPRRGARGERACKVLATRTDVGDPKALREVADRLREQLGVGHRGPRRRGRRQGGDRGRRDRRPGRRASTPARSSASSPAPSVARAAAGPTWPRAAATCPTSWTLALARVFELV